MSHQSELLGNQDRDEQENLFDAFEPPSTEVWREATVASLKGRPYEKLISRTFEGIDIAPIYRRDAAADIAHQHTLPGAAPYVRGVNAAGYLATPWLVAQTISASSPSAFNEALRHDLARGQTAVNLVCDSATRDGIAINTVRDLSAALDGVDLAETPIFIQPGANALAVTALLAAMQDVDAAKLSGSLGHDPLGEAVRGNRLALLQAYDEMAAQTRWAVENAAKLDTITVDISPYHDGGANAVQELAFALSTGVEYIRALAERNIDVETTASKIGFTFAVGANFFMEVAKLRGARLLWSQVVDAFGGSEDVQKMAIHVRTSQANKTKVDPYVNMLRATTETFAGAVGGVTSMEIAPFDDPVRSSDEFSRRIARNTQLIIQAETNMDRIIDPAGGSWYVEQLTDQLGKAAWALFQEIEGMGGMAAALMAGFPQAQVAEVTANRAAKLATRRDVLVGTNMYANLIETSLDVPAVEETSDDGQAQRSDAIALTALSTVTTGESMPAAITAAAGGASVQEIAAALRAAEGETANIKAIPLQRLAEPYEKLREAANHFVVENGHAPRVFLANMGPLAQHKARADFTVGFLSVGGFECIYPAGFGSVEEAADAALASDASAVVICSTDDTYPVVVPALTQTIKANKPEMVVLLAGLIPDQVETFKAAGVDDFVHVRANCYEMNAELQVKSGMGGQQN